MAEDILDMMREEFQHRIRSDPTIMEIRDLINAGAEYPEAEKYATRAGQLLSEVMKEYISPDLFAQLGKIEPAELAHYITPMLNQGYDYVSAATMTVQKFMNSKFGVGLQAVASEFDHSAAMNIVGKMCEYENFEDSLFMLDEPIVQNLLQVVTDTMHENLQKQSDFGLDVFVVRKAEAGACPWCRGLAGTYEYSEVSSKGEDVWRRHNDCRCEITYNMGDFYSETVQNYRYRRIRG